MKIKKLLALLLAFVMICGVFAVMPVSAETEVEEETEEVVVDDGYIFKAYQPEKHPGWAKPATVDSFNGYFTIDSTYAITTKQTYDMNTTSIRLNSVTPPSATNSMVVTISPDNYNGFGVRDNIDAGKITFILDFNHGTSVRFYSNVAELRTNGLDRLITKTDNYEIAFSKTPVITYDEWGEVLEEVTEYVLRINGYTLVTTDEEHWIARLMNAPSFAESNITIATSHLAKFNADISDYRGFATSNERNVGTESGTSAVVKGTTDDGYSVMSLDGKVAATTQAFDFTDKTLSVRPTWGINGEKHNYASSMSITFAPERRKVNKSVSDEYALCILFGPNDRDGYKNYKGIYISDSDTGSLSPWSVTTGETKKLTSYAQVQAASYDNDKKEYLYDEEYNFSFVNTGKGKWALLVNGTYIEHSAINAFCENGGLEQAYVTVSGQLKGGISASCKVIDRKVSDWVNNNKNSTSNLLWFTRTSKNDDGTNKNLIYKGSSHTTAERVNLFETTLDFTFDISSYNPAAFKITFSNEYGNAAIGLADARAKDDTIMFYVRNKYLAGSNIYWLGVDDNKTSDGNEYLVPGWSESWSGVAVRSAKTETTVNIKFNFYKEADGTYSVYINQKKFSSVNYEKLAKFCENYGEGAFVSLASTNDDRMACTPLINATNTSHRLSVDDVDVIDNSLRNVAAHTTVADIKEKVTVGKYYAVSVVNAEGEAVADDAAIGSGYKVVINYNLLKDGSAAIFAEELDIVVLGDMNGDAAADVNDLTILKKSLLNIANGNIYGYALNVAYDDALNILDYIALSKVMTD